MATLEEVLNKLKTWEQLPPYSPELVVAAALVYVLRPDVGIDEAAGIVIKLEQAILSRLA